MKKNQYKSVFDSIPDCLIISDLNGNIVEVNRAACEMYGYEKEEIVGMHAQTMVKPEYHAVLRDFLKSMFDKGTALGATIDTRKDGTTFNTEVHGSIIDYNGEKHVLAAVRDVTGRQKAEKTIQEMNARMRALLESTKDIIVFSLDSDYNYTAFNKNHKEEMLKVYNVEIEIGMNLLKSIDDPEIRKIAKQSFDRVLKGESFTEVQEQAGMDIFYEFNWNPVRAEDNRIIGISVFIRDITERKKAEKALQESERKYQDLYDNAPDMFVSVEAATAKIIACNTTLAEKTGYVKEEIIGRPIFDIYHPDCMDDVKRNFDTFVETGEIHNSELQLRRKDGSKIDVMLNVSSVKDDRGKVLYSRSAWRDISERKEMEREREELVSKLQKALDEVRTLKEFIPMCSHCKKIRNDEGFWEQVESYITKETGSHFSHGICPECKDELYGDFLNNKD
ncbi:PAS domain-containing protein [candidate division KSB1 bacterium]